MIKFPPYKPPTGGPHFWMHEQSGELAAAVRIYLAHRVDGAPAPSAEQIKLLKAYFLHWIDAPCWAGTETLGTLRRLAHLIEIPEDITLFLHYALKVGIDPL